MISKELLSEVLGEKVRSVHGAFNNIHFWVEDDEKCYTINIHELAFKVKEWAMDNMYSVKSELFRNGRGFASLEARTAGLENKNFEAETEPEAIFKAGQWILENRGST